MRTDLELIYDWVPQGAHILDLACGDGVLLERLAQEKGVTGYGLEIDPDGITQCVARGVNVIEHNLDDGLSSCLLYTSPSPRDLSTSRMPSSA